MVIVIAPFDFLFELRVRAGCEPANSCAYPYPLLLLSGEGTVDGGGVLSPLATAAYQDSLVCLEI